jgi:ABC-type nitrate/sulfonate/bicarbonate transport system permease component
MSIEWRMAIGAAIGFCLGIPLGFLIEWSLS